jgi:putative FmdB family regulatory protein
MPLYAYRCKACDHVFEKNQRMTDPPLRQCPVCAGEVRRLISNVGVVFKGSGFYITDNRNGSANGSSAKKNGSAAGETADSKSEKSSGGENSSTSAKSETASTTSSSS